jgi:DNA helicase II / ATP-dependent DNA helicase PcrA
MNFVNLLNPLQLEAVTSPAGNYLILAGAGSGKTRVLTHRIAWLIKNGANPRSILAVTFTNKAAKEMRERLNQTLDLPTSGLSMGTFHGIANLFLRHHHQEANLPPTFQILDADDQIKLIKRILKEMNISEEKISPQRVQEFINNNKENMQRPDQVDMRFVLPRVLLDIYIRYEEICKQSGLVDFTELLLRSFELWNNNPQLLEHYQNRFQHVLIDEFQDTNNLQYEWVKILARKSNLMAVGDDDQSIYSWRGANFKNMQKMLKDFKEVKIIRLEQNYRSTQNILKAANAVIAKNKDRLGKNLWTKQEEGEAISLYEAPNEIDEASYVVGKIYSLTKRDAFQNQEIAILYRSNAQSRILEEQLIRAQIPYRIYGGVRFFERAEIKDVLAYLRLLVNRRDDHALERIVNIPPRGIGESTRLIWRDFAKNNKVSLWEAANLLISGGQLPARSAKAILAFITTIKSLEEHLKLNNLAETIKNIIKLTGLRDHFANEAKEIEINRLENLEELVNATKQFELDIIRENNLDEKEINSLQIINEFLSRTVLDNQNPEKTADTKNCVQLMTLHAAKGLEFPVVFLAGLEEGLFPHLMSMNSPSEIEEERRLCYVGITRAMKKLFLTYARSRRYYGVPSFRLPSRFLSEIPGELLEGILGEDC